MKNFLKNNGVFLICFVLTLSLLWPLFNGDFFTHHDDVQIIRLFEMDKCFKDLQIPCRWVPDLGGKYGYPLFNYYAPLPYYFGEIIYLFTQNLIVSVKIMFAVSFILSYIFMYYLSRKFWGNRGGALSAIFYAFAPYHGLDFYVRGAMGEMWALMFFPAIFWAFVKLEEKTNVLNLILSSIIVAGLILSHNLSTMIFMPLVLVWIILLFLRKRQKQFLGFSLISFILAVSISAFYLLPMTVEKNLVHVNTTTYGYFSYTEHFKGLRKVILDRSWGWGASIREVPGGEREGISYQVGWVHLLGFLISLFSAWALWKKNRFLGIIILFSSAAILFSIFMIHPRSKIIWDAIVPLKFLQFPWRFLMLVIFFISFICGSITLVNIKLKKYFLSLLIIGVVGLNFSYFRPEKFIQTDDQKLLSGENWDRQIKRSIFDYLPIFAKEPPADLATQRYQILTGDTKITEFKEGTNWISFKTETNTHTIIRLSQYYFPDWKIFVDGTEVILDYKNNPLGLMTFILGQGNHTVLGKLFDTPIRSVSNLISLIAIAATVLLLLIQSKKARRWMQYYRKSLN